jgi:hypothetical protein
MNRDNLPGLSPLWLILLATTLAMFLPITLTFIYASEPIRASDWIGFAGSTLTAGVAGAAIHYAWRGITRQSRLDLISREEDRIERELPGLRDAGMLTSALYSSLANLQATKGFPEMVTHVLEMEGLRSLTNDAHLEITARLPGSDIRTRRAIRGVVGVIIARNEIARRAIAKGSPPETAIKPVMTAIEMFVGLERGYQLRIDQMEIRSEKIRAEIEKAIQ